MTYFDLIASKPTCKLVWIIYLLPNQLEKRLLFLLANKHDLRALSKLLKTHYMCQMSQSGEAYRWRVCYQRVLPRLVFKYLYKTIYCPYSNIALCLQKFPWASTSGAPSDEGIYLTKYPLPQPNMDTVQTTTGAGQH